MLHGSEIWGLIPNYKTDECSAKDYFFKLCNEIVLKKYT